MNIRTTADSSGTISSLVTFRNSQGASGRGTLLRLSRPSVVFEVYNPYSIVQLSEVLSDVIIRRGDREIYHGRAVASSLVNTGLMLVVSATLLDSWSDLRGLLDDRGRVDVEVQRFIDDWKAEQSLLPGYQLAVGELRSFFGELSRWLDQVDISEDTHGKPEIEGLDDSLFERIAAPALDQLTELFLRFEEEAAKVDGELASTHKSFVQRDLHPYLLRSPFFFRAFNKPLGYAGDYLMVEMMLANEREGPTTYAQLINAFHLRLGAAEAHRNRVAMLEQWLHAEVSERAQKAAPLRVLNIGCGPAVEVRRLLQQRSLAHDVNICLMDFNEETLEYVKDRFVEQGFVDNSRFHIRFEHESVHGLLKRTAFVRHPDHDRERPYDLIYCAGLFDYLSDKVCGRLLGLFWRMLGKTGKILVTNVHPRNPATYLMDHIAEWHLQYRDERGMAKLLPDHGIQRIYCDNTGINIFLEIEKGEGGGQ